LPKSRLERTPTRPAVRELAEGETRLIRQRVRGGVLCAQPRTMRPAHRQAHQLAICAPDISSAVMPALQTLVERTTAAGSAHFRVGGMFRARSASGVVSPSPVMDAILARSLPADTPLMRTLI